MLNWLFKWIVSKPRGIITAIAALSLLFIVALASSSIKTDIHQYFDQQYIEPLDYVREHFNEGQILSITVEAPEDDSILSLPLLQKQGAFFSQIQERWPVTVDSLVTVLNKHIDKGITNPQEGVTYGVQNISEQEDINNLIVALYQADPYEFERIARKALSNEELIDNLQELNVLSTMSGGIPDDLKYRLPNIKAARSQVTINFNASRTESREIFSEIRELAQEFSDDINIRLYSYALIDEDIDKRVISHSPWVILGMLFLLILVLYGTFRSWFFTLIPIAILSLTIVWAYGLASLLGVKEFSFLHIIPITLLLGQCIDNLIHFNERFREEFGKHSKKEALKIVFTTAGQAAGLTTIANMIAFSADIFTTNLLPVKHYALLIIIGLGIALLLTYLLTSTSILVKKNIPVRTQGVGSSGNKRAKQLFNLINNNQKKVLFIAAILFFGMLLNVARIDRNFKVTSYIAKTSPIYDAYEFERQNFSVYIPNYVLFQGDLNSEQALAAVADVQATLDEFEDVEHIHNKPNTESLTYLLSKFDERSFPESRSELYDEVAVSEVEINPITLTTASEIFPHLVEKNEDNYQATVIKFWPKQSDSEAIKTLAAAIEETGSKYPNLKIDHASEFLAFSRTMDNILTSATLATILTLIIIILIVWAAYRRFKHAIIISIPVFFGATFGFGMLPFLGVELNALNGTIGVLAIGLGVDYAIQIMTRFREELGKYEKPEEAMRETFAHMVVPLGQCVLLTTAGLVAFGGLLPVTLKFGIAAGVGLTSAYLGAVFVMPILAMKFAKK